MVNRPVESVRARAFSGSAKTSASAIGTTGGVEDDARDRAAVLCARRSAEPADQRQNRRAPQ